jgi:hypothetical protein
VIADAVGLSAMASVSSFISILLREKSYFFVGLTKINE